MWLTYAKIVNSATGMTHDELFGAAKDGNIPLKSYCEARASWLNYSLKEELLDELRSVEDLSYRSKDSGLFVNCRVLRAHLEAFSRTPDPLPRVRPGRKPATPEQRAETKRKRLQYERTRRKNAKETRTQDPSNS
jgi:hypothetical protein